MENEMIEIHIEDDEIFPENKIKKPKKRKRVAKNRKRVARKEEEPNCDKNEKSGPYKCLKRGSQFGDVCNLSEHMLIHVEEEQFKCNICGKYFARKKTLEKHMKSHPKELKKERKIKSRKKLQCDSCSLVFRKVKELKKHLQFHPLWCGICRKKFTNQSNFERHISLHLPLTRKLFKKPEINYNGIKTERRLTGKNVYVKPGITVNVKCIKTRRQNFCTRNTKVLFKHRKVKQENSSGANKEINHMYNRKVHFPKLRCISEIKCGQKICRHIFRCRRCTRTSFSMMGLYLHKAIHNRPKCNLCGELFFSEKVFKMHMRGHSFFAEQKSEKKIILPPSEKTDRKRRNEEKTQKENHESQPPRKRQRLKVKEEERNVCPICKKKFSSSSCLSRHRRVHTGEKPYKCEKCDRGFCERNVLLAHMAKHTGVPLDKKFKCEVCGKGFTRSTILSSHLRTHGEKTIKCEHCGKGFPHQKILDRHLTTHISEKKFECKHCHKTFLTKSNMKRHEKAHTGEKPFKCEKCDKTFSQEVNMKTHMRTHSGEKPFKCEECGKSFTQSGNLRNHMNIHMKKKPYKCELCGKTFAQQSNLKNHKINIHQRPGGGVKMNGANETGQRNHVVKGTSVIVDSQGREIPPAEANVIMNVTAITEKGSATNVKYRCELCSPNAEFEDSNMLMLHMQSHTKANEGSLQNQPVEGDIMMEAVCSAEILEEEQVHSEEQHAVGTTVNPLGGDREFMEATMNPPVAESNLRLVAEIAYKQQGYILPSIQFPMAIQDPPQTMQNAVPIANVNTVQVVNYAHLTEPTQAEEHHISGTQYPRPSVLVPTVHGTQSLVPNSMHPCGPTHFGHMRQQIQTVVQDPSNFHPNIGYIVQAPNIGQTYAIPTFTPSTSLQPHYYSPHPQR